jgi:release factor glutamine methyltransferase
MIAKDLLRITQDYFKAQNIPTVEADLLLAHLLGCKKSEVQLTLMKQSEEKIDEINRELRRMVLRRQNGEPLQYIIGRAPFRYLEYAVGPGVLIPRPETESLVQLVLDRKPTGSVIDLGSGSGCIAISLAKESKEVLAVTSVEKSPEAIVWLKRNVKEQDAQVRIVESDVKDACVGELFDVVVANPPYIPNTQILPANVKYEPEMALYGGNGDGMDIPDTFIKAAIRLLKSGGFFAVEHHEDQERVMVKALEGNFTDITSHRDLTGRPRFTTAVRR